MNENKKEKYSLEEDKLFEPIAKIRNGTKIKLVALVPGIKNDRKGKKVRKFARLPSQDPLTSFFLFYLVSLLGSLYAPSSFHER